MAGESSSNFYFNFVCPKLFFFSLSLLVAGNLAAVDDALVVSHLKKVTKIWKEEDIRYNKH
jgi:hypothetical protein